MKLSWEESLFLLECAIKKITVLLVVTGGVPKKLHASKR